MNTSTMPTTSTPEVLSRLPSAPLSRVFGLDRGSAIDRYYIERFIDANRGDIRGRVLEIGEPVYAPRYGGDHVSRVDVLHAVAGNRKATIIGDLATGAGIPADTFDCIILTQTLCCIFDVFAAVRNCHRALRGGGVVLATVPGISQISRYDMDRWGDYWRFTSLSVRRLFEGIFGGQGVRVAAHGNVRIAAAFLYGASLEEASPPDLNRDDPDYEMVVTIRAVKGLS